MRHTAGQRGAVRGLAGGAVAAVAAWAVLVGDRGGWWRGGPRLEAAGGRRRGDGGEGDRRRPRVVAVVPARNEGAMLAHTLPGLLAQEALAGVVLVDDQSEDDTAEVARRVAGGDPRLRVVGGRARPPGWTGKLWALRQGLDEAGAAGAEAVLFTDADIVHRAGTVAAVADLLVGEDLDLVSVMARLPTTTGWERALLPAFVYFFCQLYPFPLVARPDAPVAAAAGGCVLVRPKALAAAGGLEAIRGSVIDDVALGKLVKAGGRAGGGRLWLGLTDLVHARSRGGGLGPIWAMVTRSASVQLRHSPVLVAGTVVGMALLYGLPPVAAGVGTVAALAGTAPERRIAALAGAAGAGAYALMAASYVPTLRLYGLSPARGAGLPLVALGYVAMTVDSAVRHWLGRPGSWRGRRV